jgi:hypothetical protein
MAIEPVEILAWLYPRSSGEVGGGRWLAGRQAGDVKSLLASSLHQMRMILNKEALILPVG